MLNSASRPTVPIRRLMTALTALALAVTMAACSSDSPSDQPSSDAAGSSAPADTTTAPDDEASADEPASDEAPAEDVVPAGEELTIDALPASVQQYYGSYDTFSKLFADPYQGWTPPPAPWKFCLNDSYLGNDWRQGSLAELQRQVDLYREAGLADGELVVTDSNNDIVMQLSQFNSLVNDGCNVIFSIPGSPTALCEAMASAREQGVLVVTNDSPVYCPDSINVSWNGYWAEYVGAKAVAEALGGTGNMVSIEGIPGVPLAVAEQIAVQDVMAEFPDITLLGTVAGNWTPSVTKTEMTKFLATHPQSVDGVIDAGGEAVAALQALESSGRPLAKINSIDGPASFLAFWKEHPEVATVATNQSPASATYEAFLVAVRKLAGQDLVVNTIFYPVPQVTEANFNDFYSPDMTIESSGIPTPPGGRACPDEYFDAFFSGGGDVQLMPAPPIPTVQ